MKIYKFYLLSNLISKLDIGIKNILKLCTGSEIGFSRLIFLSLLTKNLKELILKSTRESRYQCPKSSGSGDSGAADVLLQSRLGRKSAASSGSHDPSN